MRLVGISVLVTGAAAGIGQACAVRFAREGANVCCADIRSCEGTLRQLAGSPGNAHAVSLDVTTSDAWTAGVQETIARFGRIDCLANVAGIYLAGRPDTILDVAESDFERVITTDLTAVWRGMRAVLPTMIAQRHGRIVNVASLAALRGIPNMAAYSAAKGGVVALTRQAAIEYGHSGILVNCICPGVIETPGFLKAPPEARARFVGYQVLPEFGDPNAVAGLMVHCFCGDGDFITGAVIPVDGGWSARA